MSKQQIDKTRRTLLSVGVLSALAFMSGCATQSKKLGPIQVDVSDVKDIPSLIAAIKKSAGSLLPASVTDKTFYEEFANSFVKNARAAADLGYAIPQWVLDKLPSQRKVVLPVLGVALIVVYGVPLLIPVATIIFAVLASIVLMVGAIITAISALLSSIEDPPVKTIMHRV